MMFQTVGSALLIAAMVSMAAGQSTAPATQPTTRPKTSLEQFEAMKWDTSQAGREIDLAKYNRTFNDDFKTLKIVKEDAAPGPEAVWFSPGHGAYRTNSPLRKDGPFTKVDEGVRLRVEMVGKNWKGACMTTVNTRGEGFAQQDGYFEMTAEYNYPVEKGKKPRVWGAFWLKSQQDYFNNGTTTRTEIDINEFYGDDGYHATAHLWPAAKPQPGETITKHVGISGFKHKMGPKVFEPLKIDGVVRGFHTYGGEITPEWVIMYFDRKELARFPTVEEFKTPLYMLVDCIVSKPEAEAIFPIDMVVKDVSAYQPKQPYAGQ